MKVVALAGGTGSAKLLRGLASVGVDLQVVSNVGDNFWTYGLYVCPDVDIAAYTLAGIASERKGWGIKDDTFLGLEQLRVLGEETWFKLGDKDMAVSVLRTGLLRSGVSLTEATRRICSSLGIAQQILPATDQELETRVVTPSGDLHLQEFWVRERGIPRVLKVSYRGSAAARPTAEVLSAISKADRVVVCPANPVTSIGPILAVGGLNRALKETKARIVAISPMLGRAPFSGPAGKFMAAQKVPPSSMGVAELYSGFLDAMVIAQEDAADAPRIEALGVHCIAANTLMSSSAAENRLAKEALRA